jgi:hypothetical protein
MQRFYRQIAFVLLSIFSLTLAGSPQVRAQTSSEGISFAWGDNEFGELGNGTFTTTGTDGIATPAPVSGLSNVVAIATGISHCLALKSDGTVWAWGDNTTGQLGNGTFTTTGTDGIATPAPVSGLSNVVAIAGGGHSLALRSDGTVWAWGDNTTGQLGNGTFTTSSPYGIATPAQVGGLSNVVAIAAGGAFSLALRSDGTVWVWGNNYYGELGNLTFTITAPYGIATPTQISGLSNVVAIATGSAHILALKSDGTVWAWGHNGYGELGNRTFTGSPNYGIAIPRQVIGLSHVGAIAAGNGHSLALRSDGTVWAWGQNELGQLGNGTFTTTGTDGIATPAQVSSLSNAVAIATGAWAFHSLALKSDGTVWAWGQNEFGQLGNGTFSTGVSPGIATPAQVGGLSHVGAIAAGGTHSLALGGPLRGVDVSDGAGAVPIATWQMMKGTGWQFVITDAWMGHNPNPFAQAQLQNARMAGLQTAAYCFLNFDNGSGVSNAPTNQTGTWQVQQALAQLGDEANYIAFLAIDVELGLKGNMTPVQRAARIREAINAAVDAGLFPILYTGRGPWTAPTLLNNNRDSDVTSLPLWDARYALLPGEETPFLDFNLDLGGPQSYPYGGWTHRAGKQYGYWNSASDASRTPVYWNEAFGLADADADVFDPSLFYGPFPTVLFLSGTNLTVMAGSAVAPTGTLHLLLPPPTGDVSVTLTNSNPDLVTVPSTMPIPAGQHSVTFNIQVSLPSPGGTATITASYAGISRTITVQVISAISASPRPIGTPSPPPTLH